MSAMKWIAVVAVVTLVGGFAFYQYWSSTPQFAFSDAGVAVASHDLSKFRKRVDLNTLVDGVVQDLLTDPLENTPGLTDIQHNVLIGACEVAKKKITTALTEQAEQYVANAPTAGAVGGENQSEPPGFVKDKIDELKSTASARMRQYGEEHPDSFPGRIINMPEESRKDELKRLLSDYGFTPQNFRGVAYCKENGDSCVTGAKFFSPKVNHEIVVDVSLVKAPDWRISKLSNLRTVAAQVEPSYTTDLQQLALFCVGEFRAALAATARELADQVRNRVTEKLTDLRSKVREQIESHRPPFLPAGPGGQAGPGLLPQGPPSVGPPGPPGPPGAEEGDAAPFPGGPPAPIERLERVRQRLGR